MKTHPEPVGSIGSEFSAGLDGLSSRAVSAGSLTWARFHGSLICTAGGGYHMNLLGDVGKGLEKGHYASIKLFKNMI